MRARGLAASGAAALAVTVTGCIVPEPPSVDTEVHGAAASTAGHFVSSVTRGAWRQACSELTLEARIELETRVRRGEDLPYRPSCERALSGPSFRERCREPWKRAGSAIMAYPIGEVSEHDSKPTVAWAALRGSRRRPLTRCELRLTRKDSDDSDWRIDAISFRRSVAVLARARSRLRLPTGKELP